MIFFSLKNVLDFLILIFISNPISVKRNSLLSFNLLNMWLMVSFPEYFVFGLNLFSKSGFKRRLNFSHHVKLTEFEKWNSKKIEFWRVY